MEMTTPRGTPCEFVIRHVPSGCNPNPVSTEESNTSFFYRSNAAGGAKGKSAYDSVLEIEDLDMDPLMEEQITEQSLVSDWCFGVWYYSLWPVQ
jgi:hypothetical protein